MLEKDSEDSSDNEEDVQPAISRPGAPEPASYDHIKRSGPKHPADPRCSRDNGYDHIERSGQQLAKKGHY